MSRIVHQINVPSNRPDESGPRPFSNFAERPNLVLLGDPGAGKTHLFRQSSAAEGARLVKARAFLVMPADRLAGQTLFIDGLDEKRAGRSDRDTVDALVEKLFAVSPPKVRISCRAADWLGESDLAALRPYFEQSGEPAVLLLENLSSDEQAAVIIAQGVEEATARSFLLAAEERSLGDFLHNPQNLIMLWRAVQTGSWPATRKELFELSTALMLQEFDPDRARSGTGVFSVAELRPAAGAICAARLVSDFEAISLTEQEGTAEIPGYRSLTFINHEKVQAALGRRIFVAGTEPETVDYTHRTTAEYLAAEFLADTIRAGLPFGRVAALIGVDGHPAPELRGLHAWLAVHLPEHAEELIEADPYGVLTYGDAASLSRSSCACLVRALGRLSKRNPWFRSGNWQSNAIGALSRSDMLGEFRAVLGDPDAGFGIRSVVVDALSLGTPIPEMKSDLAEILVREASPYAERAHALLALVRLGEDGKAEIVKAFRTRLGRTVNDMQLRAEVIQQLYGAPFGPSDIIALVHDMPKVEGSAGTGILWNLADSVPTADLPAVLDGIAPPSRSEEGDGDGAGSREVGSFYSRVLVRAWRGPHAFDAARALAWLRKRMAFKGLRNETRAGGLRNAMNASPERTRAIAEHFFETLVPDENRWLTFNRFREAILFQLSSSALLDILMSQIDKAEQGGPKQLFLYELGLSLSYQADQPHGSVIFERLHSMGDARTDYGEVRATATSTQLPANYFHGRSQPPGENGHARERQRQDFAAASEQIRRGAHLGWLNHLGKIYFGLYSDVDRNHTGRERIAAWLGVEHVDTALEALRAGLLRNDLPSYDDVMVMTAEHRGYQWWHALIAGLNERWAIQPGLDGISDDLLKAMLVVDLTNPVFEKHDGTEIRVIHPWKQALLNQRAEVVRDIYLAVSRLRLDRNEQMIDGLHELLTEKHFESFRGSAALGLLRDHPNANSFRLGDLLDAVSASPGVHREFLELAENVLCGNRAVDARQRDMWLTTAYLLSPSRFESEVIASAHARPELVFDLRDRSGFALRALPTDGALALHQLEFMASLTGELFPDTPHPSDGWSGDTNAWDASEHFRTLLGTISAMPTETATDALVRLEADAGLSSYRPAILHALANQRQRRRDAEYDRPDWTQTVNTLANGAPATVSDLHALLVAHLQDLKRRIERENIDLHKQFWNVDSYGRPTEPRPEELCRDYLVGLMRPSLAPLGISVEPEQHMAGDNRADISVAMPNRKILCELKRDYHGEVWTATTNQLDRFYTHDPEARGFGVYVVFWFGDKRRYRVPAPPAGMSRPTTASEMQQILTDLLPANSRRRIVAIVIDVSGEY